MDKKNAENPRETSNIPTPTAELQGSFLIAPTAVGEEQERGRKGGKNDPVWQPGGLARRIRKVARKATSYG